MSAIKIISALLALAIAGFLGFAATQPDEFRITRSLVINAPANDLFAQIVDLEKWQKWSPWVELDPEAKNEMGEIIVGEGAKLSWEGGKSGKGTMTITETKAPEFIKFQLEFFKPMEATNTAEFTLTPAPDGEKGTLVTWTMYGTNNFIGKVMSLAMNCDAMVGGQFEKGLSNLKAIVEKK